MAEKCMRNFNKYSEGDNAGKRQEMHTDFYSGSLKQRRNWEIYIHMG